MLLTEARRENKIVIVAVCWSGEEKGTRERRRYDVKMPNGENYV